MFTLITTLAQKAEFGGPIEAPSEAYAPQLDASGQSSVNMLELIISNVLGVLTVIAGLYFLMSLVMAAYTWLGAAGDSGKLKQARDTMTSALIGLVLVVAAYSIVGLIGSLVGLQLLRPGEMILQLAP